ncbi:unnamed protein product [Closterium sp. Naga37s-1]|nr:unnamed protein product [Closterium sp. Naga37s-1]
MGSYLAVAEASAADNPPKFIHVTYTPPAAGTARAGEGEEEKALKKPALIGKGHTFHLPALIGKGHTFHLPALIGKGHTFHLPALIGKGHTFHLPALIGKGHTFHLPALIGKGHTFHLPALIGKGHTFHLPALIGKGHTFHSRLIEYLFYSLIPIPPLSQWRLQLTTSSRPGSMIHPMKFDPGDTAALLQCWALPAKAVSTRS